MSPQQTDTAATDGQPGADDAAAPQDGTPARRLLVGVCGSGNLLALPNYLLALRAAEPQLELRAVLTRSAAALMPPATLRLICDEVYCDGVDELDPGHVALAVWAERFIVLPATANILGQTAHGLASGLLSTTLLAYEPPAVFFPCMNRRMWRQPSVQRNVTLLRGDGHVVVEPTEVVSWEIASRGLRKNLGLASAASLTAMVGELLRMRLGPRAAVGP